MSFLLDTDTCSAYLKGSRNVQNRFLQYGGQLNVSTITVDELFSGVLSIRASSRSFRRSANAEGEQKTERRRSRAPDTMAAILSCDCRAFPATHTLRFLR
jgi:predicted nucleic acid-binding protein